MHSNISSRFFKRKMKVQRVQSQLAKSVWSMHAVRRTFTSFHFRLLSYGFPSYFFCFIYSFYTHNVIVSLVLLLLFLSLHVTIQIIYVYISLFSFPSLPPSQYSSSWVCLLHFAYSCFNSFFLCYNKLCTRNVVFLGNAATLSLRDLLLCINCDTKLD